MRYSNLHTHTIFSDGKNTMEKYVMAAQEKNMLSLGFSDHSYTRCDESYCMMPWKYESYREKLEQLKKDSPLPIYAGLELDACSEDNSSEYDYVIACVHYLYAKGEYCSVDHMPEVNQRCMRDLFGGSPLDMAKCYCDTMLEHVTRCKPTVVGHFDIVNKFGTMPEEDDSYRNVMADCLKEVIRICPYIELNTGAIAKGWKQVPYPAEFLLDTLKAYGGKVVLGSDAHYASKLTFWFDEAVALLKTKGIESICIFNGNGFDEMPI